MEKNISKFLKDIKLLNTANKIGRTAEFIKKLSLFTVIAIFGIDLLFALKNK